MEEAEEEKPGSNAMSNYGNRNNEGVKTRRGAKTHGQDAMALRLIKMNRPDERGAASREIKNKTRWEKSKRDGDAGDASREFNPKKKWGRGAGKKLLIPHDVFGTASARADA